MARLDCHNTGNKEHVQTSEQISRGHCRGRRWQTKEHETLAGWISTQRLHLEIIKIAITELFSWSSFLTIAVKPDTSLNTFPLLEGVRTFHPKKLGQNFTWRMLEVFLEHFFELNAIFYPPLKLQLRGPKRDSKPVLVVASLLAMKLSVSLLHNDLLGFYLNALNMCSY